MKATKQGTTQGRKRSAERQAATTSKPRSRRPGAPEAEAHSRQTVAEPKPAKAQGGSLKTDGASSKVNRASSKVNGASANGHQAAAKRAPRSNGAGKVVSTTGLRRSRLGTSDAEPTRRRPRSLAKAAAEVETAPAPTAPAETSRANVLLTVVGELAQAPVETAFGASSEGPPSVDSSASAPYALTAAPASLRQRALAGVAGLPVRVLQSVGKSVDRVRAAYDKKLSGPLHTGAQALGWLSQRFARRGG